MQSRQVARKDARLIVWPIFFIGLTAIKVQKDLERGKNCFLRWRAASLSCSSIFCIRDYKCVMVEPQNCYGCTLSPRCVQQECNTACVLPCPFESRCILVATDCCPKPTCRSNQLNTLPPPVETDSPRKFPSE